MTGISASGALAYDAFQVLDVAFRKILKDKPFLFSNDNDMGNICLLSKLPNYQFYYCFIRVITDNEPNSF